MAGGKGLPLAKMAFPADQRYASSAVHSDLEVGFDSAKTMGRSFMRDIASMTRWSNALGTVETPTMAVGRMASSAAWKSEAPGRSWAKRSLCSASPVRLFTTSPWLSTKAQRRRASSGVAPSSTMADTISSPMPMPASPAPRKSSFCSRRDFPVRRRAE